MKDDIVKPESTQLATWTPNFISSTHEMKSRVQAKRAFYKDVMVIEQHYGKIPGSDKDVLFKPGAELLLSSMGLFADLVDAQVVQDYDGSAHGGEPLIAYRRACLVYRQTGPTENERVRITRAEGFCSSREKKYRYRDSKPECPMCGKQTIFDSKKDGGFFCWKKEGGCGVAFDARDERITKQPKGKVYNPEIYDLENTILKMADKRAYVAATLLATGCSDIFTQDLEDDHHDQRNVTPQDAQRNGESNEKKLHDARGATKELIAAKAIPHEAVVSMWQDLIGDNLLDYQIWESGDISMIRSMYKVLKAWQPPDGSPPEPTRTETVLAKMNGSHPVTIEHEPIAEESSRPEADITADMVVHQAKRKGLDVETTLRALILKTTGTSDLTQSNIHKVMEAVNNLDLPMITEEELAKLAGNVPMVDMRSLAIVAHKCGLTGSELVSEIVSMVGSVPLTSESYRIVIGNLDARIAATAQ